MFSFPYTAAGVTDAVLRSPESVKGEDKNIEVGDTVGKSQTVSSPVSTSTLTNSIFSSGTTTEKSNLNNGSLASSPFIFSSSSNANQNSAAISVFISSPAPIFSFGSLLPSTTSVSAESQFMVLNTMIQW